MAKRFRYLCADPGIPIPGLKGASIHVESVVGALVSRGLEGELYCARPTAEQLCGVPIQKLPQGVDDLDDRQLALSQSRLDTASDIDFIYERYSLWHQDGPRQARRANVPFVVEVNSPLIDEAQRYRTLPHPELAHQVARNVLSAADVVVTVSQQVADWGVGFRGHDRGVVVIENGVDAERFSCPIDRRTTALDPNVPWLVFCGSFRPWHGTDELLQALAVLRGEFGSDAHLLMIGDGPEREAFEARARQLGLDDVIRLTGQVPHTEVAHWAQAADVAVAPYPKLDDFYFSPLKIFEFMAMGLPVAAPRLGQIAELLGDGERGRLYDSGDPRDLARCLAGLLNDSTTAGRVAHAGRTWVLENATWTCRVEQILERIEASR